MEFTVEHEDIKELCNSVVQELAHRVRAEMSQTIMEELSLSSAAEYLSSMSDLYGVEGEAWFTIEGFLPVALETGLQPFDMKSGFLNKPEAKRAQDGSYYRRVPLGDNPYQIRTVSSKQGAEAWRHPGIDPKNFFERAVEKSEL